MALNEPVGTSEIQDYTGTGVTLEPEVSNPPPAGPLQNHGTSPGSLLPAPAW